MEKLEIPRLSREQFLYSLENDAKMRVDTYIESAVELAEEVHSGLVREDGTSLFLETHTWPVALDVVTHYRNAKRNITSVEVAAAILHDVMEDDDRILNFYESKSYGFEAYLEYRFGSKIRDIALELKIKPLANYPGENDAEKQLARFQEYCDLLQSADYDVKAIKLADRLNNMNFIRRVAGHTKVARYLREGEDFYIAYSMLPPKMPDYYSRLRKAYEQLRTLPLREALVSQ
jgi:(p)ppGpp synthase/HD superfamily hydrolase